MPVNTIIHAAVARWGDRARRHERGAVTALGMILTAGTAFCGGVMTSDVWRAAPLVVEHAPVVVADGAASPVAAVPVLPADCLYVGSRNSTKYYPPDCQFAKRIAPENLRCFVSDEDAQAKGYARSTGC